MLSAKRLPQILHDALGEGIEGICLMTVEGSLLSSAFLSNHDDSLGINTLNDVNLPGIASSVWSNYNQSISDVFMHMVKVETGYLGICEAGNGYLLAAYIHNQQAGLLRARLIHLSQYFKNVFEQIK